MGSSLPTPGTGRDAAETWVADHLADLVGDPDRIVGSDRFRGGQSAADAALAVFDVAGYAERRNQVLPESARGASGLSPYIRHGLLTLRQVWRHVAGGPGRDVAKFHDELMWQEYARHWYLHNGAATARGVRREQARVDADADWDRSMACVDATFTELERDGWLVNQTRMWLASEWAVRRDGAWQVGEEHFFRHLLDGSRAANRLGWQWTVGVGSSKHYGFSRSQVERRAPELCRGCAHRSACPIADWPDEPVWQPSGGVEPVSSGFDPGPGIGTIRTTGAAAHAVWLTAESLGDDDPALAAHPDLPAVFVFDEALLARLRLSAKRLIFLAETLADLANRRDVEVHRGRPVDVLGGRPVAVTFAPVPGFTRIVGRVQLVEVHPFPWLVRPTAGPNSSFSAWRRHH